MSTATFKTRPRDLKPGALVRTESLDADFRSVYGEAQVISCESLGHNRYAVLLEGEDKHRYVGSRFEFDVIKPVRLHDVRG